MERNLIEKMTERTEILFGMIENRSRLFLKDRRPTEHKIFRPDPALEYMGTLGNTNSEIITLRVPRNAWILSIDQKSWMYL